MTLRRCLPKTLSDTLSFLFLVISAVAMYFFELLIVIPEVHADSWHLHIHTVAGTYILFNILGNIFKVMVTDTSSRDIILPSLLKPFWRFCPSCEANAPPRAFHCDKCKACILKRDHHCVFTGCCVGLKNFRYYLAFLLHLALGCLYASVLNMFFVWGALGGFSLFSVVAHFVPFLLWELGYLEAHLAFYALMSMLSITGFFFVLHLFALHFRQMLKNQTTFEKNHRVSDFDLGWKQNLVESLGTRFRYVWLFPFAFSPLPSDGLAFNLKRDYSTSAPKVK